MSDEPESNAVTREQTSGIHYTHEMATEEYKNRISRIDTNNPTYSDVLRFRDNGVKYSVEGYPDFSPYSKAEIELPILAANASTDQLRAYKQHYGSNPVPEIVRENYTWHHVENTKTMQLVPRWLNETVPHYGGRHVNRVLQENPSMIAPPAARDSLIQQSMQTQQGFQHERMMQRAHAAEHRAGAALGVAAIGVDLAHGDISGAALDTASAAAETRTAQDAAMKAAAHVGLTSTFNRAMRMLPVVGSYMTYRNMQDEVKQFTEAGQPDLAEAAYQVGKAEILGGIAGGWSADAAREAARAAYIQQGGSAYEQIAHAGSVQLAITATDLATRAHVQQLPTPPTGKSLADILPANHASMAQGADAMGERSEVSRIAIERTGLAAHDPRNNMSLLAQDATCPTGHLLILADGSAQGPECGAVPFDSNPQIAAGKNGGTLGILYAGTGAMNDAQWNTVTQVTDWLNQQRAAENLPGPAELIAGSTATAALLNLPSPRGPLPSATAPQPGIAPTQPQIQPQRRLAIGGLSA